MNKNKITYADDDYDSIGLLVRLRGPSLVIGLVFGLAISLVTSRFEEVLSQNIHVAYFLPFIVYIADAIGSQTQTIYAGDLKSGKAKFLNYFKKETILGLFFGVIFGGIAGIIAQLWIGNNLLSFSVAISTFLAIFVAPIAALIITEIIQLLKEDPASNSSPVTTVVQDMISVVIYGLVCSLIML